MGRDKALVELAGRPLIAYAVETLKQAGLSAEIAGARNDLSAFAPVILDETADAGPLSGICSALAVAKVEWAVFLSVDMPLLPASLIRYLVWDASMTGSAITWVSMNGFAETFPAAVRRSALPYLLTELKHGRASCRAGFHAAAAGESVRVLPVERLVQTGQVSHPLGLPAMRWFHNVNSPRELARAECWLAGVIS
jgi:molybdopterin-guanine dinucleotide biosynthesis protein A